MDSRVEIVKQILENKGCVYYIGGSQRFGYNIADSDLDVHVLAVSKKDLIREWQLRPTKYYLLESRLFETWQTILFGLRVQIVFHTSANEFDDLADEHVRVAQYLAAHPDVLAFIQALRTMSLHDGRAVYAALVALEAMSEKLAV